jgi:hypothetical protein
MWIRFSVLDMLEVIWGGYFKVWRRITKDAPKRSLDVLEHAAALHKVQLGWMTIVCEND